MKKYEIEICLGSSCFLRGNKKVVKEIQKYLKDNKLEDRVIFNGKRCFGECVNGPMLRINDTLYEKIDEYKVIEILNDVFIKVI